MSALSSLRLSVVYRKDLHLPSTPSPGSPSPRPDVRARSQPPLTEQADAQPGQALLEPLAQALRELPPPLLLPGVVLLIEGEPVHVSGQARGQVGDGSEGT